MAENILNKAQKEAIEYLDGPLMIVAGAGTGKTTVITEKIKYILEKNLALPEQILALTFNEKAAGEMQERLDKMLSIGYVDMQISTFHSFAQRILENYGLDIGLSNQFRVLTETDAWLLMKKNLDKFNLDYYKPLGNPVRYIHEMLKHFSKCKDELITSQEYLSYAQDLKLDKENLEEKNRLSEIADAYHTYNQLLLDNNALDFGDLIFYSVELFKKKKGILQKLQERFRYILVDEFQDVNYAQYEMVKLLTGDKNQLTVVGDDDQSIYAFRGANVSNILRFKEDYKNCKEIVLTENYRSGQKILDIAYKSIINNNPDRLEIKLKIDKKLQAKGNLKEGMVIHSHHHNLDEEVRFVVEEIIQLKEKDGQANWDDFAILFRANSHAEPFMNLLENYGIPYEFLSSTGLFRQEIVLDCYNFFKAIHGYHENTAVYRLLQLPFLNLSEDDMQQMLFFAYRKGISYYEAMKRGVEYNLSKEGQSIFSKLLELLHEGMRQQRTEKPTRVLCNFMENSGYFKYLTKGEQNGDRKIIRQIYQLRQYLDYIKNYEDMIPGARVADFVTYFADVLDAGDLGIIKQPVDTPDSVNLMTVHMSKGLEFKYVFIVNLVEDRFPSKNRGDGIEIPLPLIKEQMPEGDFHLEEERRLFYVAITRAKERLYFTSAHDYGGMRSKKISRFLDELGYKAEYDIVQSSKKLLLKNQKKLEENKGEFIYELPKVFSYSQISTYKECPYKYKLQNILKLQVKRSPQLSFGSTIHSTLYKFYNRIRELNSITQESLFAIPLKLEQVKNKKEIRVPTLKELLQIYEESFIDDWYRSAKQKEDYYLRGKDILCNYYKYNDSKWQIPIALEQNFKCRIGSYFLSGKIDRIDKLEDGTLRILDYKTGNIKGEDKDQLLIYQLAVKDLPEFKNIGQVGALTYFYLFDLEEVTFIGQMKDLEKLKNKIVEIIDKIQKRDFLATPEKYTCSHCDFKDICDFRI